jgi:hypothetical protein
MPEGFLENGETLRTAHIVPMSFERVKREKVACDFCRNG